MHYGEKKKIILIFGSKMTFCSQEDIKGTNELIDVHNPLIEQTKMFLSKAH